MYWNNASGFGRALTGMINYNMRCIEILTANFRHYPANRINYNMRCIEISPKSMIKPFLFDKLQHEMYWNASLYFSFMEATRDKLQHEMYWNIARKCYNATAIPDKLQHEMYWNNVSTSLTSPVAWDKLQHEMYWNPWADIAASLWEDDKLQHEMYWNINGSKKLDTYFSINYNMRCIEIRLFLS